MVDRTSRPAPAQSNGNHSSVVGTTKLPNDDWKPFWTEILVEDALRDHIYGQALFSLELKRLKRPVTTAAHGLLVFAGPPGTGKSTIARGLANELTSDVGEIMFAEINSHNLPSDMLGQSQRAITGLFDTELARLCEHAKTAILLIDEVEALAVSRSEASLKANPVDVHRATDAVLEGLDRAATLYPSLLLIVSRVRLSETVVDSR